MQKYNNVANHMNLLVPLMNIVSVIMIVFFATKKPSIDTISPMIVFGLVWKLNSGLCYHMHRKLKV